MADDVQDNKDLLNWVRAHPEYTVTLSGRSWGIWIDVCKPEAGLEHSIKRPHDCADSLLEQLNEALVAMGEPAETAGEEEATRPVVEPPSQAKPRRSSRLKARLKGFEFVREKPVQVHDDAAPKPGPETVAEPATSPSASAIQKNPDDLWASDVPIERAAGAISTAKEDVDTGNFPKEVVQLLGQIDEMEKKQRPLPIQTKGWELAHELIDKSKEKAPDPPAGSKAPNAATGSDAEDAAADEG